MGCDECGEKTEILDTRTYKEENNDFIFTQRRRVCLECKNRFNTIEVTMDVWKQMFDE